MGQDDALRRAQAGGTGATIPGGHAPVADPLPPRIRHTGAVDDEGPAQKAEVAMLEIGRLGMPASPIGGAPARAVPYLPREAVASSGIGGTGATHG